MIHASLILKIALALLSCSRATGTLVCPGVAPADTRTPEPSDISWNGMTFSGNKIPMDKVLNVRNITNAEQYWYSEWNDQISVIGDSRVGTIAEFPKVNLPRYFAMSGSGLFHGMKFGMPKIDISPWMISYEGVNNINANPIWTNGVASVFFCPSKTVLEDFYSNFYTLMFKYRTITPFQPKPGVGNDCSGETILISSGVFDIQYPGGSFKGSENRVLYSVRVLVISGTFSFDSTEFVVSVWAYCFSNPSNLLKRLDVVASLGASRTPTRSSTSGKEFFMCQDKALVGNWASCTVLTCPESEINMFTLNAERDACEGTPGCFFHLGPHDPNPTDGRPMYPSDGSDSIHGSTRMKAFWQPLGRKHKCKSPHNIPLTTNTSLTGSTTDITNQLASCQKVYPPLTSHWSMHTGPLRSKSGPPSVVRSSTQGLKGVHLGFCWIICFGDETASEKDFQNLENQMTKNMNTIFPELKQLSSDLRRSQIYARTLGSAINGITHRLTQDEQYTEKAFQTSQSEIQAVEHQVYQAKAQIAINEINIQLIMSYVNDQDSLYKRAAKNNWPIDGNGCVDIGGVITTTKIPIPNGTLPTVAPAPDPIDPFTGTPAPAPTFLGQASTWWQALLDILIFVLFLFIIWLAVKCYRARAKPRI